MDAESIQQAMVCNELPYKGQCVFLEYMSLELLLYLFDLDHCVRGA
jgi:hypothetical protein